MRSLDMQGVAAGTRGWAVEPFTGQLHMSIPMPPGPSTYSSNQVPRRIPLNMGISLYGSGRTSRSAVFKTVNGAWEPDTSKHTSLPTYLIPQIGFIAPDFARLEDGSHFNFNTGTEPIPLDSALLSASGITPNQAGLGMERVTGTNLILVNNIGRYGFAGADRITPPIDWGQATSQTWKYSDPSSFTAVISDGFTRIFAYIQGLNVCVPVVWRTPEGMITLQWARHAVSEPAGATHRLDVQMRNGAGIGYDLHWWEYDPATEVEVLRLSVEPVGFVSHTMSVYGIPKPLAGDAFLPDHPPTTFLRQAPFLMVARPTRVVIGPDTWHFTHLDDLRLASIGEPGGVTTVFEYAFEQVGDVTLSSPPGSPECGVSALRWATVKRATTTHGASTLSRAWERQRNPQDGTTLVTMASSFNSLPANLTTGLHTVLTYASAWNTQFLPPVQRQQRKRGTVVIEQTDFAYENRGEYVPPLFTGSETTYPDPAHPAPKTSLTVGYGTGPRSRVHETTVKGPSGEVITQTSRSYQDRNAPTAYASGHVETVVEIDGTATVEPRSHTTQVEYSHTSYTESTGYNAKPTRSYLDGGSERRGTTLGYSGGALSTETPYVWVAGTQKPLPSTTMTFDATWGQVETRTTVVGLPGLNELKEQVLEYDGMGRPKKILGVDGKQIVQTMDAYGRLLSQSREGLTTTWNHSPFQESVSLPDGRHTNRGWDAFGRVLEESDGLTAVTYNYDETANGSIVSLQRGGFQQSVTYDDLGRPVQELATGQAPITHSYWVSGNLLVRTTTRTVGGTLRTSKTWTNPRGRVVQAMDEDGNVHGFSYDAFGNTRSSSITTPSGTTQTRARQFDGMGRLIESVDPETGTTTYSNFNALGLAETITENGTRTRQLTYDTLGRLKTVTASATGNASTLVNTFTYHGQHLKSTSSMQAEGGTVTNAYSRNAQGFIESESVSDGCFSATTRYETTPQGWIKQITYPSGLVVRYQLGAQGRVTGVYVQNRLPDGTLTAESQLATLTYESAVPGRPTQVTFKSGSNSGVTLDGLQRAGTWTVKKASGSTVRNVDHDYNGETGEMTNAGDWNQVTYDKLGRIASAQASSNLLLGALTTTHTHDAFGNATKHGVSQTNVGGMHRWETASVLPTNHMPNILKNNASSGWAYNSYGEAISLNKYAGSSAPGISMTWDVLGRMIKTTPFLSSDPTEKFTYSASGLRFGVDRGAKGTYRHIYGFHGLLLSEFDANGVWKRDVIYAGATPIAEVDVKGIHELHLDHLGTPKFVTHMATKKLETALIYGPHGERIATRGDGSPTAGYLPLTGYTGHVSADESGLIYMRGRYYSPTWQRFVNSDRGVDPRSPNQYAYVGGSPFMATDPSGMYWIEFPGRWIEKEITDSSGVTLTAIYMESRRIWIDDSFAKTVEKFTIDGSEYIYENRYDPDYLSITGAAFIGVGFGVTITIDRWGRTYYSIGGGFGVGKGGSFMLGTIIDGPRDKVSVANFLNSKTYTWQIGYGAALGGTTSLNASGITAIEIGAAGPGISTTWNTDLLNIFKSIFGKGAP